MPLNHLSQKNIAIVLGLTLSGLSLTAAHAETTNQPPAVKLSLDEYLQQVLHQNETVQAQLLDAELNHHKAKGEYGVFEPVLATSITREANARTNNVQQQAAQGGSAFFSERNTIYDAGLEQLIPTGGKIRLGYTLSDLNNNVNPYSSVLTLTNSPFTKQYQTFVGVTFNQPLLKNAGTTATMASIRLAALDSDISFQEYRRQLMLTLFQAECAYWDLYFAQEQVRFFDDSVAVAQTVLDDSQEKMKSGQGSELDVMEAQSGLALRNTKRNDALQNYYDALGRMQSLTGQSPAPEQIGQPTPPVEVTDVPQETNAVISYADCYNQAFKLNPDYLVQQLKESQELVRYGFAKNQVLPDLNLKTAYGYNGLGTTPDSSWSLIESATFPSWSVGLELDIPLFGNIKTRNQYHAAKLALNEASLRLKGVQTQIGNGLNTAVQKCRAWEQSIQSYETVVHYNEELLKTQTERLKAGRVDGHKVLNVEADLLDSRQELANAQTQFQRALLQVELTDGAILQNRNLDITRKELRQQTEALVHELDAPKWLH